MSCAGKSDTRKATTVAFGYNSLLRLDSGHGYNVMTANECNLLEYVMLGLGLEPTFMLS